MSLLSSADHRIILTTGGNKGIGLEAVRQISEQLPLATILLGTRTLSSGETAINKLRQSADSSSAYCNIHPLVLDVTDATSIDRAVREVREKYGRLDVLVNNSGLLVYGEHDTHVQEVFAVNLYGLYAVTAAFLPLLVPQGLVLNVSSETGSWATHACGSDIQQVARPSHAHMGGSGRAGEGVHRHKPIIAVATGATDELPCK